MAPANGGDILSSHPKKFEIYAEIRRKIQSKISLMAEEERKKKWGKSGKDNPNWRNGGSSKKLCPRCEHVWIASTYKTCGGGVGIGQEKEPLSLERIIQIKPKNG